MSQIANQHPLQAVNSSELLKNVSQFKNLPVESIELLQTLIVADQTLEICRQLAYKLCATQMVPKIYQMLGKNEDDAQLAAESGAVAIMWGCEIGLQPLQSLQNVAVINGNPALWGDSLVAIVKASGQCGFLTTSYDEQTKTAICTTQRKGEPEETRTFSWDEAVTAGLTTKNQSIYQKYAKRMISARARSHLLRDVYADLLKGFKVREVEEDDYVKEKDVTPPNRSNTISQLLKSKPVQEPESKTKQAEPIKTEIEEQPKAPPITENPVSTPKQANNQKPTEKQILIFESYKEGINVALMEEINDLGLQIGKCAEKGELTKLQIDELKDIYVGKLKELKEQNTDKPPK